MFLIGAIFSFLCSSLSFFSMYNPPRPLIPDRIRFIIIIIVVYTSTHRHWKTIHHPTATGSRGGRRSCRNPLRSAQRVAAANVAVAAKRSTAHDGVRFVVVSVVSVVCILVVVAVVSVGDVRRQCVDCARNNERKYGVQTCVCLFVCVCCKRMRVFLTAR